MIRGGHIDLAIRRFEVMDKGDIANWMILVRWSGVGGAMDRRGANGSWR